MYIEDAIEEVGTDTKVQKLGLQGLVVAYNAAIHEFQTFVQGVGSWSFPVTFDPLREQFNVLVANIEKHRLTCRSTPELSRARSPTTGRCMGTQYGYGVRNVTEFGTG